MNIDMDNAHSQLFGTISYQTEESLERFMDSISKEQAIYLVKIAIEFSHHRGVFNMNEAEVLNKSLRILNKIFFNHDEPKVEE